MDCQEFAVKIVRDIEVADERELAQHVGTCDECCERFAERLAALETNGFLTVYRQNRGAVA